MIHLSEKHGVNPSIMHCWFCGEDKGIALVGVLPNDEQAPKDAIYDREPCDKCVEMMKQGVMIIETPDGETGKDPKRTGRLWVLKDSAIRKMIKNKDALEDVLNHRMCFMHEQVTKSLGLPREVPKKPEEPIVEKPSGKKTTGPYTHKQYKCRACGTISEHGTNHWGAIYPACRKGICRGMIHDCLEQMPEGYEKPEEWKMAKLGDVMDIVEVRKRKVQK